MDEWIFKRTTMGFILDERLYRIVPIQIDQDRWHLIYLGEAMDGCRDDIFLPMSIQQDLLAKTGVPKACYDRTQVSGESVFIYRP